MTQCRRILAHLKRGPITPMQALDQYGCFRLAARIADLREEGHPILTERVKRNNKVYARYRLAKVKNS
jgi:hypothetical protein